MNIHKIVSRTEDSMQVVILALVEQQYRTGKKQIRKVSITRHLQKQGDMWMGWTPMKDSQHPLAIRVDFTDAVKKLNSEVKS